MISYYVGSLIKLKKKKKNAPALFKSILNECR